jgi:hypothetical protein
MGKDAEEIEQVMQMEEKEKEGTQVRGGDINACLSSIEIDNFCQPNIPSDLFFRLRNGEVDINTVRRTITNARQATGGDTRQLLFIGHFRHHWVAIECIFGDAAAEGAGDELRIYDSAPSPMVARDIRRLADDCGWPIPRFIPSPRQQRGTSECGLFAMAAVFLLRRGHALPTGVFSLATLRDILHYTGNIDEQREAFVSLAEQLFGLRPADHYFNFCG